MGKVVLIVFVGKNDYLDMVVSPVIPTLKNLSQECGQPGQHRSDVVCFVVGKTVLNISRPQGSCFSKSLWFSLLGEIDFGLFDPGLVSRPFQSSEL